MSLKLTSWTAAEKQIAALLRQADEGILKPETRTASKPVSECLEAYFTACVLIPLARGTLIYYRSNGKRLLEFCKRHHISYLSQIDGDLLDKWRMEWKQAGYSDGTCALRLSFTKRFFKYAFAKKWCEVNPTTTMPPTRFKPATKKDTMPLDVDGGEHEYQKILASLAHNDRRKSRSPYYALKDPKRLVALTKLFYESGLRISDGVLFDLRSVVADEHCASYEFIPHKVRRFGRIFSTFVSPELYDEIKALGCLTPGRPFWLGPELDSKNSEAFEASMSAHRLIVGKALSDAGDMAGIPDVHAHRFRNSFAVSQLNNGARTEDVARWLGHSSVLTTERYYAPWVKSRFEASRRAWIETQKKKKAS